MIIEKDKYLDKWVVWLKSQSAYFMQFSATTKKECKAYIKKVKKERK